MRPTESINITMELLLPAMTFRIHPQIITSMRVWGPNNQLLKRSTGMHFLGHTSSRNQHNNVYNTFLIY